MPLRSWARAFAVVLFAHWADESKAEKRSNSTEICLIYLDGKSSLGGVFVAICRGNGQCTQVGAICGDASSALCSVGGVIGYPSIIVPDGGLMTQLRTRCLVQLLPNQLAA